MNSSFFSSSLTIPFCHQFLRPKIIHVVVFNFLHSTRVRLLFSLFPHDFVFPTIFSFPGLFLSPSAPHRFSLSLLLLLFHVHIPLIFLPPPHRHAARYSDVAAACLGSYQTTEKSQTPVAFPVKVSARPEYKIINFLLQFGET